MSGDLFRPRRRYSVGGNAFNRAAFVSGAVVLLGCLLTSNAHATPSLGFQVDGDTYGSFFAIANLSDAGEEVTGFRLDLAPAGICFDQIVQPCDSSSGVGLRSGGRDRHIDRSRVWSGRCQRNIVDSSV